MRRFKQFFASFLAMNLTISTAATGIMNVNAAGEYSSEAAYETYAEESAQTYAEDTVAPEQVISDTDAAYYSSDMESEVNDTAVVSAETDTTASTVVETTAAQVSGEENQTELSTETPVVSSIENENTVTSSEIAPTQSMQEGEGSTENTTQEVSTVDESVSEENSSEEASSEVESESDKEDSFTAFAADENKIIGVIDLKTLKGYSNTNGTEKVTIEKAEELILLSNCDPKEIQNITIEISATGGLNFTTIIEADSDLSRFFSDTIVNTDSDEEKQSADVVSDSTLNISDDTLETDATEEVQETISSSGENRDEVVVEGNEQNSREVQSKVLAGQDYEFQGIGSKEYPFRGKITGTNIPLTVNRAFFGGLSSNAEIELNEVGSRLTLNWSGDGTKPMIADIYQFDSVTDSNNSLLVTVIRDTNNSKAVMGSLLGIVQASEGNESGVLKIDNENVVYSGSIEVSSTEGNAGLICSTLGSGTICLDGYTIPSSSTVQVSSNNGNAGGLIGEIEKNATLKIESPLTNVTTSGTNGVVTSITIAAKQNAGGLVGKMASGSKIVTGENGAVNLKSMTITGSASAGGVVGDAENVNFSNDDLKVGITIDSPSVNGSAVGANVGGFVGKYTIGSDLETAAWSYPTQITIITPDVNISGNTNENGGNAGGYFGLLELKNKASYTIGSEASESKSIFEVKYSKAGAAYAYGGLIGQVTVTDKKSTLKIQNLNVTSKYVSYNASDNGTSRPKWHSGLIGCVGDGKNTTYLEVTGVDITAYDPHSTSDGYFGGVASYLASKSIIKANNIKVTTNTDSGDKKIWEGGGILGQAAAGSVLELSGYTDLTDTWYDTGNTKTAQLVGANDSALIYAKGSGSDSGWTYERSELNKDSKGKIGVYNDLLCYGQVIRLKSNGDTSSSALSNDLITINGEHDVELKTNTGTWNISGDEFTFALSNADDFALLSIAWNSRGNFGVSGIDTSNWRKICSSTITLTGDIDLTGTGITGLSRDTVTSSKEGDDTFSGTLNGSGHKLTLSIGETFGTRSDSTIEGHADGSGIVYAVNSYHASQGIFARTSNATIQNIVIDGSISVSNGFDEGTMAAGGIAAVTVGSVTIDNVTAQEIIYVDGAKQKEVSVGGLFGKESGGELELKENTEIAPKITLANINSSNNNGTWAYAGGIMGRISTANYKVKISSATLGNSESEEANRSYITTDATEYAYIGGLVGLIDGKSNHWIEIHNLAINGFNINAASATQATGGLFGSVWQNVGVYFMRANDETPSDKTSMLTVQNAKVTAGSAGAGGLAYRSSGIWEIRDKGIDIQSLSINSKGDVGLLVCRGEKGNIKISDTVKDTNIGGLYVKMTAYWETAYKLATNNNISITQTTGVFDEFVAHTAATANVITDTNKNGIISIATKDDGNGSRVGVDEDGTTCTTYQNRTWYGEYKCKTNGCSRYYYDLDQWLKEVYEDNSHRKNGNIDTAQELMLWSVYWYADSAIRDYIVKQKVDGKDTINKYEAVDSYTPGKLNGYDRWFIQPAESGKPIILDMKKYSYYPVRIDSLSINFSNAILTFYNKQIESAEETYNNKSTAGTRPSHTQHFTMHCGLLFNYTSPNGTLTVDTVTFSGSIGKIHNNDNDMNDYGSGALIANTANGYLSKNNTVVPVSVNIRNSVLSGMKVYNCGEKYAPLLINTLGSYTKLSIINIKTESYTEGTAVASSLIGKVGSSTAKQINLSFEDILLPDKKAETTGTKGTGIFSHATLLESFTHDGTSSGATYNFLMGKEWNEDKYTHGVTYGKEITESVEYTNMQRWYYDEIGYKTDPNLVHTEKDQINFSSADYLPYVYVGYEDGKPNHEIKVNQRMDNIVNGCGTYGHPYVIKTSGEMTTLANYIRGDNAPQGWCVTITGDQSINHQIDGDYASDVTYKRQSTGWVKVKKDSNQSSENWSQETGANILPDEVMRAYLRNAYYDLQGEEKDNKYILEITNFGGFGISTYPFRGVLTSTTNTTVVLKGNAPKNGFIGYSYGSVIKNLTISYSECNSNELSDGKETDYYSSGTFGGIIGCVLGGDNIIDNVSVQYANNSLSLTEDKKHLIPVGGYVGEIAGGGVVFRNIKSSDTGLQDSNVTGATKIGTDTAYQNLYVNPYVGRVLDGFAIYEVTKTGTDSGEFLPSLNNTKKNYQITTLDKNNDKNRVTIENSGTDSIVNIVDAKGLFVLSAVVNSGAASGGNSNTYNISANDASQKVNNVQYNFAGKYGKVRNASYDFIGQDVSTAATDFALSRADDQNKPGGENNTSNFPYLVTQYCSNASSVFSLCGDTSVQIQLQANTSYDMTTFGAGYQGIGARYFSNAILADGTLNPKSIVPEIASFDGNGSTVTVNTVVREYTDDDFPTATVGGVFNELRVGISGSNIQNLTIQGAVDDDGKPAAEVSLQYYDGNGNSASKSDTTVDIGGFAGTVSRISLDSSNIAVAKFDAVIVRNLKITGPRNAGGLLGSSITKSATDGVNAEERLLYAYTETENKIFAKKNDVGIQLSNVKHENLAVTALMGAGGFVGYLKTSESSLVVTQDNWTVGQNSTITSKYDVDCKKNNSQTGVSATGQETETGAGGVFGYVNCNVTINSATELTCKEAKMQDVTIKAARYAGGFIGKIAGNIYTINQASFEITDKTGASISTKVAIQDNSTNSGSSDSRREGAGGIIGYAKGKYNSTNTIANCTIKGIQVNDAGTAIKELNQDHEGAGGIVGLITDGKSVTIENCTVTNSNIYGAVAGGIAGITRITTTFQNCTVTGASELKKSNIKARCTASGILGYWFGGTPATATLEKCYVQNLDIAGQHWGVGALIGDSEKNTGALNLFDSSVQDSDVTAKDGSWYQGGGIIGDLRCDLTASNLLFSNVKITVGAGGNKGLLVAKMDADNKKIYIAGVSIQNIPTDNQEYPLVGGSKSYTGYIAFADYSGTALDESDSSKRGTGTDLLGITTAAVAPYVVTSPKSQLSVHDIENGKATFLYGDGAYWTGTTSYTMAQTIFAAKDEANEKHYAYKSTGVTEFKFDSAISTYNANQTTPVSDDFPVLQISGGDSETVQNYLDILTNGGFTAANNLNSKAGTHVDATATVYSYQNGKFVKAVDSDGKPITPALTVSKDDKNQITFSTTTDYDNTRDRFTLLTVTFEENTHRYNVLVPIIVRRMLEIDFSATLTYGTDFKSSNYYNLDSHVLESYGSSITGYLTYIYNSKNGEYTDYGWDSYINAGGNAIDSISKKIRFATTSTSTLPEGMQLTLVDPVTGRAYYYTATGNEQKKDNLYFDIELNKFADSGGNFYQEQSISELMKATAENDGNGKFIKVDEKGKPIGSESSDETSYPAPTVKIKGENEYDYYRLADESLKEKGTYSIHVTDGNLQKSGKSLITESYYLVIMVPDTTKVTALNGSIQTEIGSSIPHQLNYRKIGNNAPDNHENTASTYQLSTGYQQELNETGDSGVSKKITVADTSLTVNVTDKITFPIGQAYNDNDQLYLRIVGNLMKTVSQAVSSEQFPSGTIGLVQFYVYTQDPNETKTYYSFSNSQWSSDTTEKVASEYTWTSNGGNMELVLSTDGTVENAISLAGVRKDIKSKAGDGTFYVMVKMEAKLPASGLEVIPESKVGNNSVPTEYAKLAYSSQISTEKTSLTYSSNRASVSKTTTAYYREEPTGTKLTYEADQISQLGINLLDLQYLDASREHSLIDTTAVYDLSSLKNLDDTLKNSTGIKFTLSLLPKDTTENPEDYQKAITDVSNYLTVELKSINSGNVTCKSSDSWSWIVPQSTYWLNDTIKTDSVFNGSILTQAIQLKVNVTNVEQNHYYSNYKVVLTAEILDSNGNSISGTHQDDNIIYTLAKIKPEFVE